MSYDVPGSSSTYVIRAVGIEDVFGSYFGNLGFQRGFHNLGGTLYLLDPPGSVETNNQAVSPNGDFAGKYRDNAGSHYFVAVCPPSQVPCTN